MPATTGNIAARMAGARGSMTANALTVTTVAIGFIAGGLGILAGMGIDKLKNNMVAHDQKKILADHYREQIAAQLGMDPRNVDVKDLEQAARVNPAFADLLQKVHREQAQADRTTMLAAGAVGAVGAATGGMSLIIPGASGAVNTAATLGLHGAAAVGGGAVSSLFNKDTLTVQDVAELIDTKLSQGQPVTAMDVMLLRVAQNEASMPDIYQAAETDAEALMSGRVTQQDLVVSSPGQQSGASWTQRVGGRRASQGSFVQAYEAEQTTGANRTR